MRSARCIVAAMLLCACASVRAEPLVVGSKVFTESVILSEIVAQLLDESGVDSAHRRELGGTRVLWSALVRGDIDCYPEYTGTLRAEDLVRRAARRAGSGYGARARRACAPPPPLGFNNTYVLGMKRERARKLGMASMSQLAAAS